MRCDLPILVKCCFCVPLRTGLLIWGYIKLIISLFLVLGSLLFVDMSPVTLSSISNVYFVGMLVLGTIDIVFQIIFIVSAHKKIYKLMRAYYLYIIIYLFIPLLLLVTYITVLFVEHGSFAIMFVVFTPIILTIIYVPIELFLGIYFILLVRSEFLKLKNNAKFQFFNHAAEPTCTSVLSPSDITVIDNVNSYYLSTSARTKMESS